MFRLLIAALFPAAVCGAPVAAQNNEIVVAPGPGTPVRRHLAGWLILTCLAGSLIINCMPKLKPILNICRYKVKPGKEAEMERLLAAHWPALHKAGLVTDEE